MPTIDIPKELLRLKNPPKKLFAIGKKELLECKKIAIVGSRKASYYSKEAVRKLSSILSSNKIVVVSGGAMGIDAAAHIGAFPNTIAVLANSLDIFYPKINYKLLKDISEKGLLISEHQPTTCATKYSFVLRNRLVVGLCDALVIGEADLSSGSLRSAEFALELEVPIYVLPHRLNESEGTKMLLREGKAKEIENLSDFADTFAGKSLQKNLDILCIGDEILEFCAKNSDLNICLRKFGEKIFEYELEGKIKIADMKVSLI
ncbi:MAG: DNA-protecting protein DprA [Campylobacteraceae bacterium]|jgi:DNA processing protein|nr:DNA-protecting protein DprA [Campylobacteraceae bacterium]